MFQVPEGFSNDQTGNGLNKVEYDYVIKKNDLLTIDIFTNGGEKLIDPNPEMVNSTTGNPDTQSEVLYLVGLDGLVKFPLIGQLKVEGLTVRQAEQMIEKEFEFYYKDPFVHLKVKNKRVIVLGDPGGQVISLENENTTLVEVIALAKGVHNTGKATNIRVLRGDKTMLIDLSTIEGFKSGNMIINPGDIVYIEPIRKPLAEGFRDYGIIFTFILSTATLLTLLTR